MFSDFSSLTNESEDDVANTNSTSKTKKAQFVLKGVLKAPRAAQFSAQHIYSMYSLNLHQASKLTCAGRRDYGGKSGSESGVPAW